MADLLAQRIQAQQARIIDHERVLRAALPVVADALRRLGATKIVLFGSLATGRSLHERSDIDLCVDGIDSTVAARFEIETLPVPVHVVCRQDASPRLLESIASGITLVDEDRA